MALIAHYKLNGDAHDSIGQNHGSVWGSVLFEQGVIGDAFSTEDATGRIDTGMPPSRFINDFSISCWVRVKQWGLSVGVFGNRVSPNGFMFYRNTGDSDNLLRIYMHYEREGDSNTAVSNTWNQFPTNEWFHVVFRRRKDSYDLWFNGQRVIARNSMPSTFTRWAESGNINLRIGAGGSGWTTRNMDIDDFRVFDHNLSEKEIQQLYKPDVVPDLRNVELDGEQGPDFLELADYPFIPGSNTLSMWVYPTTTDMRQTLWNNGYGGEGTINFETNGRLRIYVGPAGGNQAGYTSLDSTILPLNEWTHATAVITNSQLRWYINGSLAATRGISFDRGETSFLPRLGTGYTNYFRGRIKGFSSFAGELSDEEILSLYRTKASLDSEGNLHSSARIGASDIIEEGIELAVSSSGNDDGNVTFVNINGANEAYRLRGHNFVAVKPDGTVLSRANFDTHGWTRYRIDSPVNTSATLQETVEAMVDYLDSLPNNVFVCVFVHDQGQHTQAAVHSAMYRLGFRTHEAIGYRDGWAAISSNRMSMLEETSQRYSGIPANITTYLAEKFSIKESINNFPYLSEVAISESLQAYVPFKGSFENLVNSGDGINQGSEFTAEGLKIIGGSSTTIPNRPEYSTSNFTYSMWFRHDSDVTGSFRQFLEKAPRQPGLWLHNTSNRIHFSVHFDSGLNRSCDSVTEIPNNTWVHVTVQADWDGTSTTLRFYLNGNLERQSVINNEKPTDSLADIELKLNSTEFRDFRIYNRALTEEEVAILYNITNPEGSKMSITQECVYLKGELKET